MDEETKKKLLASLKLSYLLFLKKKFQEKLGRQKNMIFYPPKEEIIITGEDIGKIREWREEEAQKKNTEKIKIKKPIVG